LKADGTVRLVYLILGCFCLVLAVLGFILPLMPGTPFLLLASLFFSKSSERLHSWLLQHRYLGPPIRDWEEHGSISKRVKIISTACIVVAMSISLWTLDLSAFQSTLFFILIVLVLMFIWTRPSR
jgi:hypothetical protein